MFFLMQSFAENPDPNSFTIGIILIITSTVSGFYCKIVDDSCSSFTVRRYIDSVPDERKDMAKSLFPKRYWNDSK